MIKIAITGPESAGKSTLAKQLSEQFDGAFVPEFARDYVTNLGRAYTYDDVAIIAKQQIKEYDRAYRLIEHKQPIVFFDTFLIITKVWFEVVYGRCPVWLDENIRQKKMDLYLLCSPDLPWVADGVRENGNIRSELFERYRSNLEHFGFRYEIITGCGATRTTTAIEKINTLLYEQSKIPNRTEPNN